MKIIRFGAFTMAMVAVVALSVPAAAQDCRILRVGGAKRFSDPVKTADALQAMFKEKQAEIEKMLAEARGPAPPRTS